MRYPVIIILFFLTQSATAQTDVQRAELKGPVKRYTYKNYDAYAVVDSIPYHYACNFDRDGYKIVDTSYTEYCHRYPKSVRLFPYAVRNYINSGNTTNATYYERKGDDTTGKFSIVMKYNEKGILQSIEEIDLLKNDSTKNVTSYSYFDNGKIEKVYKGYRYADGIWSPTRDITFNYSENTESIIYYDRNPSLYAKIYKVENLYDDSGRVVKSFEYLAGEKKPYSTGEWFYYDSEQIPKIKPKFFKGSRYKRYIIWHKDAYGNYLNKARVFNKKLYSRTAYTVEYNK